MSEVKETPTQQAEIPAPSDDVQYSCRGCLKFKKKSTMQEDPKKPGRLLCPTCIANLKLNQSPVVQRAKHTRAKHNTKNAVKFLGDIK